MTERVSREKRERGDLWLRAPLSVRSKRDALAKDEMTQRWSHRGQGDHLASQRANLQRCVQRLAPVSRPHARGQNHGITGEAIPVSCSHTEASHLFRQQIDDFLMENKVAPSVQAAVANAWTRWGAENWAS